MRARMDLWEDKLSTKMAASVAVVGAGVCGLSTAVCILQRDPTVRVTVIADKFSPDTCTDGAAGVIMPFTAVKPFELQRFVDTLALGMHFSLVFRIWSITGANRPSLFL